MTATLTTLRRELKQAGYTLTVKTYSDFKAGTIRNIAGQTMPSIFTPETLAQWQTAIDIKNQYKGKLFDNGLRVVL